MHSLASVAGWGFLGLWVLLAVGLVVALRKNGARMPAELWARLVLWSVPSWLVVILLVHVPFALLGLLLVYWQAANVETRVSPDYAGPRAARRVLTQFRAWFMWPYCNFEDGVDGLRGGDARQAWWRELTRGLSREQRIFKWSALRNPFNNLRYVPVLRPRFHPPQIGYVGTGDEPPDGQAGWAYVWQGLYSGLYIKSTTHWLWLGWKLRPSDRSGISPTDTRLPRVDFATQFQKVY